MNSSANECKHDSDAPALRFKFIEFNSRRHARGADAARVEVFYDNGEESEWLWMSKTDIQNNIRDFGDCEELQKALVGYSEPVEFSNYS